MQDKEDHVHLIYTKLATPDLASFQHLTGFTCPADDDDGFRHLK